MKAFPLVLIFAATITQATPEAVVQLREPAAVLNAEQCKCSIEIAVISHATGAAIRGAEIDLEGGLPGAAVKMTSTTDEMGRATFRRLAQGIYHIRAQRDG